MTTPQSADDDNVEFVEADAIAVGGRDDAARNRIVMLLPIEIAVCVGSARLTVAELMNLKREQIIPLDSLISDPVDILVGERVVARGELVDLEGEDGGIGVRLIAVCDAGSPP